MENLYFIFKRLNMSDSGFKTYFSFLWHSSLPCFDIPNITGERDGETAILKKCLWKGQLLPCSAIFKKVCEIYAQMNFSDPF